MLRFIYTVLLTLVSPFFLFSLFKKKHGRPSVGKRWREHFGLTPPLTNKSFQPVVWFHAVSVGEVLAVTPLVRQYASENPEHKILVTTTTPTGAEQALKLSSIAEHRYMPLDFGFAIRRFLRVVKPTKLVIIETELWPNTLTEVSKADIPIIVINARLSERSYRSYSKVRPFFWLAAQHITRLCCQFKEDAERFRRLGVTSDKVSITGSIKFDIKVNEHTLYQGKELRTILGSDRPVWIAASTHEGEDIQVLAAHKKILETNPNILLVLVPRHPERFNDVEQLCKKQNLSVVRRSQHLHKLPEHAHVFLGDTMGDMMMYLAASDVCFMGGSLLGNKVGGHNLLEPAAIGVATVTGPSYFNFSQIVKMLLEVDALEVINDEHELAESVEKLLNDDSLRLGRVNAANKVVEESVGALNSTLSYIREMP
ncbi:lipid IV(A) 3-deoxy-D-manno-octulosonic acid transferase [Vibrio sp. SCSIO 43133]|uniref:lipid IV(A) 3-deoxy-D-manno-octulosonic acid transferase n=1 Tax=Vibrio sp. SCSIO 43133 TaxID=2802577 RepID=UPI0020763D05|nr:lipid IV(A) 3-deoxy-D-manno-octulosonic acid transferase [Vibrio sp. SCSIO 43133]USE00354.1 lipid IV(A) 3-deoxy-D-manno-octulosonic acid transferase [Vibrio sp. SCSIO 43133]